MYLHTTEYGCVTRMVMMMMVMVMVNDPWMLWMVTAPPPDEGREEAGLIGCAIYPRRLLVIKTCRGRIAGVSRGQRTDPFASRAFTRGGGKALGTKQACDGCFTYSDSRLDVHPIAVRLEPWPTPGHREIVIHSLLSLLLLMDFQLYTSSVIRASRSTGEGDEVWDVSSELPHPLDRYPYHSMRGAHWSVGQ